MATNQKCDYFVMETTSKQLKEVLDNNGITNYTITYFYKKIEELKDVWQCKAADAFYEKTKVTLLTTKSNNDSEIQQGIKQLSELIDILNLNAKQNKELDEKMYKYVKTLIGEYNKEEKLAKKYKERGEKRTSMKTSNRKK